MTDLLRQQAASRFGRRRGVPSSESERQSLLRDQDRETFEMGEIDHDRPPGYVPDRARPDPPASPLEAAESRQAAFSTNRRPALRRRTTIGRVFGSPAYTRVPPQMRNPVREPSTPQRETNRGEATNAIQNARQPAPPPPVDPVRMAERNAERTAIVNERTNRPINPIVSGAGRFAASAPSAIASGIKEYGPKAVDAIKNSNVASRDSISQGISAGAGVLETLITSRSQVTQAALEAGGKAIRSYITAPQNYKPDSNFDRGNCEYLFCLSKLKVLYKMADLRRQMMAASVFGQRPPRGPRITSTSIDRLRLSMDSMRRENEPADLSVAPERPRDYDPDDDVQSRPSRRQIRSNEPLPYTDRQVREVIQTTDRQELPQSMWTNIYGSDPVPVTAEMRQFATTARPQPVTPVGAVAAPPPMRDPVPPPGNTITAAEERAREMRARADIVDARTNRPINPAISGAGRAAASAPSSIARGLKEYGPKVVDAIKNSNVASRDSISQGISAGAGVVENLINTRGQVTRAALEAGGKAIRSYITAPQSYKPDSNFDRGDSFTTASTYASIAN